MRRVRSERCARASMVCGVESRDVARSRRDDRALSHRGGRGGQSFAVRVSALLDGRFGRQRGCAGLSDGHRSRVAQLVTDDRPTPAVGDEAARLKELCPESALRGDDQPEAVDSLSLVTDGTSGSFSAACARRFGDFRRWDFRHLWLQRTGWQARSVQAPYKHFDANVNHDVDVIHHDAPRCTMMRGRKWLKIQIVMRCAAS